MKGKNKHRGANADLKAECRENGIEWVEVAKYLKVSEKDLIRRLNRGDVTPAFRRQIQKAIRACKSRPEDFYWSLY